MACAFALAAQEPAGHILERAGSLVQENRRDEARALLDGIRSSPELSQLERFQLGWLYGRVRQYQTAIAIFESLPEAVPDPATHHYAIALSYFNLGQYTKTVEVLTRLKERKLADSKALNLLGVALAKAGEAEKAYNQLREGVVEGAGDPTAYRNLVTLCVDYGNLALAEKIATSGLEAFPSAAELWLSRGMVRLLTGKREEARDDLQHAAKSDPKSTDAAFFLALAAYELNRFPEAAATLRHVIEQGIADPDIHYLLAETLLRLDPDNPAPVIEQLDRALAHDPNSVPALVARGKLLLQAGNAKGAAVDLERARAADPESRSAAFNLARAYQRLGRKEEADELLKHVRQDSQQTLEAFTNRKVRQVLVERSTTR
jgi:tetratricopeptide (TPR) repeat protein